MSQNDAIHLLDKYLQGTCSEEERRKVEAWLESMGETSEWAEFSMQERQRFIRCLYEGIQDKISTDEQTDTASLAIRRRWIYWSAAAVLLMAAAFGLLYQTVLKSEEMNPSVEMTYVKTGVGETKKIVLEDRSVVWLNAMSQISYPEKFGTKERKISLEGEGFFEVETDPGRPFLVQSATLSTRVLGTSFNIRAYQEDKQIAIAVFTGKVAVHSVEEDGNTLSLSSGEQLKYDRETAQLEKDAASRLAEYAAWREDKLFFFHTPMAEVVKVLHRALGLNIHLEDDKMLGYEISGQFDKKQDAKSILKAICLSIGGQYQKEGREVRISSVRE